jgi:hypothetical protein
VTTIALRVGHSIAADRLISGDVPCASRKLFTFDGIGILAICGGVDDVMTMVELLTKFGVDGASERRATFRASCEGLLVRSDGLVSSLWFGHKTKRLRVMPMESPFYAIGSGGHVALGAMATGVTPKRAVEIATQFDPGTGMGVDVIRWPA